MGNIVLGLAENLTKAKTFCMYGLHLLKWVVSEGNILHQTIPGFTNVVKKHFESIMDKAENAGNQHFLFFPQCFLLYLRKLTPVHVNFNLSSAYIFNSDQSKIVVW